MPRAVVKPCAQPGCPELVAKGAPYGRCPEDAAAYDRARGGTVQRGYGAAHRRLRARWAPVVARGGATCARCEQPIEPGQAWDLGHTDRRDAWTGPEHASCNRAAGGRR